MSDEKKSELALYHCKECGTQITEAQRNRSGLCDSCVQKQEIKEK